MIDTRTVGKTIAALRQKKGMTQQALAASLNVTHQAVSRWENGITMPDLETMLSLSRLFGVTMEQIVSGEAAEDEKPGLGKKLLNLFGLNDEARSIFNETPDAEPAEEPVKEEAPAEEETVSAEDTASDASEEPQSEPEFEEKKAAAEDHAPKESSSPFNLEKILKIAPFMSKDALDAIVKKCAGTADWAMVTALAPFVSRETLRNIVSETMKEQKADKRVIVKLAPFLGSDLLTELLMQNTATLDWSTLSALAPFLDKDVVGKLAMALSELPETEAAPGAQKKTVTLESVFNDVGKTLTEIGNGISGAVESALKTFGVNTSSSPKTAPVEEEKPKASERRKNALELIISKALEDKNIAWLKEHVCEIENHDLLNRIAETALSADERDLFTDALETLGRDEADIAAALAVEYGKAEWLDDELEYITDSKILTRFAEAALNKNDMNMFSDALVNLDDVSREALCQKAQDANQIDALEELLQAGCSDSVLLYAVSRSLMDLTEDAAENATDDALTNALEIAVASSDWPIINILTEFMD